MIGCYLSLKLESLHAAEAEAEKRGGSDEYVAVCLKGSGQVVGDVFAGLEEDDDTFSVGWNFSADFGGLGLALEAASAWFGHLFAWAEGKKYVPTLIPVDAAFGARSNPLTGRDRRCFTSGPGARVIGFERRAASHA